MKTNQKPDIDDAHATGTHQELEKSIHDINVVIDDLSECGHYHSQLKLAAARNRLKDIVEGDE